MWQLLRDRGALRTAAVLPADAAFYPESDGNIRVATWTARDDGELPGLTVARWSRGRWTVVRRFDGWMRSTVMGLRGGTLYMRNVDGVFALDLASGETTTVVAVPDADTNDRC